MNVVQEPEVLDARMIRWTALGLVLAVLLCSAAAVAIVRASAGALAPAGFVAGRETQSVREIAAIELELFATLNGRGQRGQARPGQSPLGGAPPETPPLLPLEAALRAYLAGERAPRAARDPLVDPTRVQPEALP